MADQQPGLKWRRFQICPTSWLVPAHIAESVVTRYLFGMNNRDWPTLTKPLPLDGSTVHVVRLDLQAEPMQIETLRAVLSAEELVRADRYKFEEPRRRFIACRAALRQLLGACLGGEPDSVAFEYGPHGKPGLVGSSLANEDKAPLTLNLSPDHLSGGARRGEGTEKRMQDQAPVEFSVSHSGDLALIAITAGRRVGVDVEQRDAKVRILKLATRFFSPREAAQLASLPEPEQLAGFYQGWTSKEAYLKATGFGLSFPLSKFTVELNPHEPARLLEVVDQPDEAAHWRMHSLDVAAGFSTALLIEAVAQESVDVRQWSLQ